MAARHQYTSFLLAKPLPICTLTLHWKFNWRIYFILEDNERIWDFSSSRNSGEIPKAFVVTTPDADLDEEAVKEYVLENLGEYKHPREVEVIEELPRTTTGKVQKFKLRKRGPVKAE